MRREMRSAMPGDYGNIFSGAELDDLVAYIVTLRSENEPAMKKLELDTGSRLFLTGRRWLLSKA